ncbi:hypothetical protein [Pleomorphomonas sp. PLEO]|uniref:hypothetical protein n=1 Tax=Pleomorphomonas sp. PLEO TaxID=3239306 RepID=UPI00351E2078
MTPERFRQIVEAYGAAPQRWPEKERAAAEIFARENIETRELLAREAGLDHLLGTYHVALPDSALMGAVIASRPQFHRLPWIWLLQGLGIVGAGLAGAIAGAFLMTVYAPSAQPLIDEDEQPILTSFDVGVGYFDLGETQ